MPDQDTYGPGVTIVVAAFLAVTACAAWIYLQSQEIGQKSLLITNQRNSMESLQQKLADFRTRNTTLEEKAQKLQYDLEHTNASLNDVLSGNWQEKYEELNTEFVQIKKEYELQSRIADNEQKRLQHSLRYYQAENNAIEKSLADLNESQKQAEDVIRQLQADNDQASRLVADLEKQLLETGKRLAEKPAVVKKIDTDSRGLQQYRRTRLQSLRNALVTRDSGTRKAILMDVIPTIPAGLEAAELLSLVEGMHSRDILAVIQATHQYVIRPIDNNSMSKLAGTMDEEDAVIASLVLSGE